MLQTKLTLREYEKYNRVKCCPVLFENGVKEGQSGVNIYCMDDSYDVVNVTDKRMVDLCLNCSFIVCVYDGIKEKRSKKFGNL
jgi:hypothetical protein